MATFPALEPTSRSLTFGDYPQLFYEGVSGDVVRFITSTDRVGQRLTLGYEYLTESEVQEIITHYRDQNGGVQPFTLPNEVWAGYSSRPIPAADYQWRYAETFAVSIISPLRYSVTIELESVVV